LRGDIEVQLVPAVQECCAVVDPSELEIALINLAVNARDAMPNGGKIVIRLRPTPLTGQPDNLHGDFIAIDVTDSGGGIPSEVVANVFEPFFTTKEVGKGTGLGLSQVFGFARQSGGTAVVTDTSQHGTTLTLLLPATNEKPSRAPVIESAQPHSPLGTRVLLVEDNVDVSAVTRGYLEHLGYRPVVASDATRALGLLETEKFPLACSDIMMPGGKNGLDLARIIRRRWPEISVLLMTGYSLNTDEAVKEGFEVLHKPFDLQGLDRALRGLQKQPVIPRINFH
jgi:two-component system NtrC family sensor kinase